MKKITFGVFVLSVIIFFIGLRHADAQQTVDDFWQRNKDSAVGATSGFQFFTQVVNRWMTANLIQKQDPVLAKDMEIYLLKPSRGSSISDGYVDWIQEVGMIENPSSPRYKYRQIDVEKFIDLSIQAPFKERIGKLKIPFPFPPAH